MSEASVPAGLVATYHVEADESAAADGRRMSATDFAGLFQEERAGAIADYLSRTADGEHIVTFELLKSGETRLLLLESNVHDGDSPGGILARLVEVAGISVPEHLTSRVLGMRSAVIHQICNDLSAARLNSELAEKILQGKEEAVDLRVMDALRSVIRLSATVETQLRDLQRSVKLNFQGTIDEEFGERSPAARIDS